MARVEFNDIASEIDTGAVLWESTGPDPADWRRAGVAFRIGDPDLESRICVVTPDGEVRPVGYLDQLAGEVAIDVHADERRDLAAWQPLREVLSAEGMLVTTETLTPVELDLQISVVPEIRGSAVPLTDPDVMPTLIFTGTCNFCSHKDHGANKCKPCGVSGPCA